MQPRSAESLPEEVEEAGHANPVYKQIEPAKPAGAANGYHGTIPVMVHRDEHIIQKATDAKDRVEGAFFVKSAKFDGLHPVKRALNSLGNYCRRPIEVPCPGGTVATRKTGLVRRGRYWISTWTQA
jgi:hypothetical protein